MARLTERARLRSCTLRLSACNGDPETTILAHANSNGKGLGFKSPDWWGAWSCSSCHDIVDGRVTDGTPKWVIDEAWLRGLFETQDTLFNEGILKSIDSIHR